MCNWELLGTEPVDKDINQIYFIVCQSLSIAYYWQIVVPTDILPYDSSEKCTTSKIATIVQAFVTILLCTTHLIFVYWYQVFSIIIYQK